jgi:heme A synthase
VVPLPLAVLHQLGAFVLLGCGIVVQHTLSRHAKAAA